VTPHDHACILSMIVGRRHTGTLYRPNSSDQIASGDRVTKIDTGFDQSLMLAECEAVATRHVKYDRARSLGFLF